MNINPIFIRKKLVRTMLVVVAVMLTACGSHGHSTGDNHVDGHADGHADAHGDNSEGHHDSVAGAAGEASNVGRAIAVDMNDNMQFTPASIDVKAGETIRFDVSNSGKIIHEFVIGSNEEILEHNELMKRFPGMEHDDEPNSVSLQADENGEVIWQFTRAGSYSFACLQPGHFDAGMKGEFIVSAR